MDKTEQTKVLIDDNAIEVKSSDKKTTILWIVVIVLLLGQCGVMYWAWQQQQAVNQQLTQDIIDSTPEPVDIIEFERSLVQQGQQFASQLNLLKTDVTSMQDGIEALKNSQQLTQGDVEYYWTIAEINYLLNVANQQVLLANNTQAANEALKLADARVESLSDYRLHPLRAKIAEEMLALSSANKVDVQGISLQLKSALNGVKDLQVLMAAPVEAENDSTISGENWQGVLDNAWQEVKSLVVIRHQQDGAAAVLVPEQRYFLYQNLTLKLEAAQLALLNGNEDLFKQSLAACHEWLSLYFTGDKRDAMLALLANLQTQDIHVELPDISGSLTWLRGFAQ
jgi:uroporphyrin-3 C-methyltransferase